jgi:hypothetical protein
VFVGLGSQHKLEAIKRPALRTTAWGQGRPYPGRGMTDEISKHEYHGVDWKQDLHFSRAELAEHLRVGEGTRSLCIAVERFVMRSALAFRKLQDQRTLSDEVRNATWAARRYPCVQRPDPRAWFDGTVDLVNYHHIARHYKLDDPEATKLGLQELAHSLIHSFVFVVWPEPGDDVPHDTSFFFNSDKTKNDVVWQMSVGEFQTVIDAVVSDDVLWISANKATGEFRQHNSAWRPPRGRLS